MDLELKEKTKEDMAEAVREVIQDKIKNYPYLQDIINIKTAELWDNYLKENYPNKTDREVIDDNGGYWGAEGIDKEEFYLEALFEVTYEIMKKL